MITVGSEYSRQLGSNKQYVTITKICDDGTVEAISKSGRQKFHTRIENVNKWTLIKAAENTTRSAPERAERVNVVKDNSKKRLNARPFVEILIDTIIANNKPMNAKQLVDKVKEDGSYKFKEGIKTPWNSASTRLNTYIREAGENSKIKFIARGVFVPKDYQS